MNHPGTAIAGRHHKRLKAAWEDAMQGSEQNDDRFSVFARNLHQVPDESHEATRERLKTVGLTNAPLALKLGTYHDARDNYLDFGKAEHLQAEPKSQWFGWRKLFGRVLQTSGVILGSTASEVPGGEYIKEFVEEIHLLTEIARDVTEMSSGESLIFSCVSICISLDSFWDIKIQLTQLPP